MSNKRVNGDRAARAERIALLTLALTLTCATATAQEALPAERPAAETARTADDERLARVLDLAGRGVECYFGGMFSITYTETLRAQELKEDLTPKGRAKEWVFENIVVPRRSASGQELYAEAIRRLKSINGKPVRGKDAVIKPGKCGGPTAGYSLPLGFLLPQHRGQHVFSHEGEEVYDGRRSHVVRVAPRERFEPSVGWKGNCFYAGFTHEWRVWIDAETYDVLRLDARLVEGFEFESPRAFNAGLFRIGPSRTLRYERSEGTTRFRRVRFTNPEQTLLLPVSAERLTVIRGALRARVTQTFTDYRRFVSDVKIIEDSGPEN
jgi:hypothetical protein